VNTRANRENARREGVFTAFRLQDAQFRNQYGVYIGDYITGGAKWPRSVVPPNASLTDPNRGGLRYIEVEGYCDQDYDGRLEAEGNKLIRTYVRVNSNTPPKRRCYEDGVWGPLYGDTRCILSEVCNPFNLTIYNMYKVIEYYQGNSTGSSSVHLPLNTFFAIKQVFEDRNIESQKILTGCPTTSVAYNALRVGWQTGSDKFSEVNKCAITRLEVDQNFPVNETTTLIPNAQIGAAIWARRALVSNVNKRYLCNTTETTGNYASGWNFEDIDIYNYFKPITCNTLTNINKDGNFYDGGASLATLLVRAEGLAANNPPQASKGPYVKESFFEFVYDAMNNKTSDPMYLETSPISTIPSIATTYRDVRNKTVTIKGLNSQADFVYPSYQISTICRLGFFNLLKNNQAADEADMQAKYYKRNIVLECALKSDTDSTPVYKYPTITTVVANSATEKKLPEQNEDVIGFDDCKPMKCGGRNISARRHWYTQRNWTTSIVKEAFDLNSEGEIGVNDDQDLPVTNMVDGRRDFSILRCDSNGGYPAAFIVPDELKNDFKCISGGGMNANNSVLKCNTGNLNEYLEYNFITEFRARCKSAKKIPGYVNGIQIDEESYLYNRVGEIEMTDGSGKDIIPKTFCTDLEKTSCETLTEDYIADNHEFLSKFCVPLICLKHEVSNGKVKG
jgi:hypothetical protein